MPLKLTIFSDGGSRGNPGPAASAFLILSDNAVIKAESDFLGKRTNNQAEYEALIAALESAAELGAEEIVCYLDSELVCKHLTGEYKVKNADLRKLWDRVQKLKSRFRSVQFLNVPRSNKYIQEADSLVNEQLDESAK
jgi:ribonuclease HI